MFAVLSGPIIFLARVFEEGTTLSDISLGIFGTIAGIFFVGGFIPALAASVRRLHDTNKSGWWLLLTAVPVLGLIGAIILLLFFFLDGGPRSNQYGPDPKGRG